MSQRTILLAEDDAAHSELIRRAVTQVNSEYAVHVVRNGVEMIDYLFINDSATGVGGQMPDLILLDLKMPEMDGLKVLQVLRRVRGEEPWKFPPVVVLTSSDDDTDIAKAYHLGAHSFIRKPLEFSQMVTAIRQIVTYWLGLNRSPRPRRSEALLTRPRPQQPMFLDEDPPPAHEPHT